MLFSHGAAVLVQKCQEVITQPNVRDSEVVPLKGAPWVVAIHHNDTIRMLGFSHEEHAKDMYDSISMTWAKVLMRAEKTKV